ncbi:hypothetical protein JOC78_001006 [Bacillus ectoiniformans]|uniref:oligosaccharide repeat unit polymerase n=1 Tax=Bacillus ectoiniformans TaxID=1494429 RepID=UPI0019599593|nr:oligosaccharide repeat unit polymerase [Bacillus ectoiniformans]MBM7648066.1 hypothetical protein [Bacillus ectoiniformans]
MNRLNNLDVFSPVFMFPFTLICYFVAGIVFDFGRSDLFMLKDNIIPVVGLGLCSFIIAALITSKRRIRFPSFKVTFKFIYIFYLLFFAGIISYLSMVSTGEIGLKDESIRRSLDPKKYFLSSFLWFSSLYIGFHHLKVERTKKSRLWLFFMLLFFNIAAFILMGYRTPIVIMCFVSLITFHYTVRKLKFQTFLVITILFTSVLCFFGFYRTMTEDQQIKFNTHEISQTKEQEKKESNELIKVNSTPKWIRGVTEPFATGRIVLSRIIEYENENGNLSGKLHLSIFQTLMPGEQKSPRVLVTDAVNSLSDTGRPVTREGRTTTPTLVGQFYLDGGYVLVITGFSLVGLVLGMIYNHVITSSNTSYWPIVYAFFLTVMTISIHTGLLDSLFILMLCISLLIGVIDSNAKE